MTDEPASNAVVIGGAWHSSRCEVRSWHSFAADDHDLEFKPGGGARKRVGVPDLFVVHVTGGEGDPSAMYRTLRARELGVEFAIDVDGVVWQMCDPLEVDTFDAGAINRRSVGVEIVNYGYRADPKTVPLKGKARPLYDCIIHGRRVMMARSNPAQLAALVALADVLTSSPLLSIPRKLPRTLSGEVHGRLMDRAEVAAFSGVLGHLHVSGAKIDPGMDVFDALDAAGYG